MANHVESEVKAETIGMTAGFRFSEKNGQPHPIYNSHEFANIVTNRFHNTADAIRIVKDALIEISLLKSKYKMVRVVGFSTFESNLPDGTTTVINVVVVEGSPELMNILAKTDRCAMPAHNGVLYHYVPIEGQSTQKTFHISLANDVDGSRAKCLNIGDILLITSGFCRLENPPKPFYHIDMKE